MFTTEQIEEDQCAVRKKIVGYDPIDSSNHWVEMMMTKIEKP